MTAPRITMPDGGPAFPLKEPLTSDCLGMSLRDYFAAKAMQSIVALNCCPATMVAEDAYAIADAMLERRREIFGGDHD